MPIGSDGGYYPHGYSSMNGSASPPGWDRPYRSGMTRRDYLESLKREAEEREQQEKRQQVIAEGQTKK